MPGDQFTFVAAPTVTSLATTSGPTAGGTSVVITGTNLTAASAVRFGATNAASFTVNSATQITAVSPAGSAGTVDVTVTTAGGTSATVPGDQFTFVAAPTVTSLATTSGPTAGGTSVVITGTNLTAASAVRFGATNAASFTVNSATQITAVSPAGSAGTVDVTVTTAGGTSATVPGDQFTFLAAPTVASLSPASGLPAGGTTVVITGTNFNGVTAVKFGAVNAASFTFNSATQITATSPAGTGTVDVTVTTPGGTSATNAGDQFTYASNPTVTATTTQVVKSATSLTITGTNFSTTPGNNTVVFTPAGTTGTVTAATATSLTVSVSGLTNGVLSAVVTVGSNNSGAAVQVANVVDVPITIVGGVLSFDASTSTVGINTSVTFIPGPPDLLRFHDSNRVLGAGPGMTQVDSNTVTIPLSLVTSIVLNGSSVADNFTLDYVNGDPSPPAVAPAFAPTVTVNGGLPDSAPGDTLAFDGLFGSPTYTPTGVGSGLVDPGTGGSTVSFTGMEPLDFTGSTLTGFTLNMSCPSATGTGAGVIATVDSANAAGVITPGGVNTLVSFSGQGAGQESALVGAMTGTFTINGDNTFNDYFVLNNVGTAMAANMIVDGLGGADDVIDIHNTTFTLPGLNKNLTLRADFIVLGKQNLPTFATTGNIVCSGDILLEANGDSTAPVQPWNNSLAVPSATTGVWGALPGYVIQGSVAPLSTLGSIQISGSITKNAGNNATLTLKGRNSIGLMNNGAGISGTIITTNNKLNVVVNSDSDGINGGGVVFQSNSSITTLGGDVTIGGGSDPTTMPSVGTIGGGNTAGVLVNNMGITTTTAGPASTGGNVSIIGSGFPSGTTNCFGVFFTVSNGATPDATISTGTGSISITGTGGGSTTSCPGVQISGAASATPASIRYVRLNTSTGPISITGTATVGTNNGVMLASNVDISSTGATPISITGSGTGTPSGVVGYGILSSPSATGSATSVVSSTGGTITLKADTMNLVGNLGGTTTISSNAVGGSIAVKQNTATRPIELGLAVDTVTTLGISTAEFARLNAPTITIGDSNSGTINVSAVIAPAASVATLALANNTTFAATGGFTSTISSASNFTKMTVVGTVDINTNATLAMNASGYIWNGTDTFTIINNDGSDAIANGPFTGPTLTNFLGSALTIGQSYTGGTGNDLVFGTAPTISASTAPVLINSTTLIITGTGFSTIPANNIVTLSNGATGTVTAATSTQLTVTLSTPAVGSLTAVVNTGISSGAPVQVATIIPVITPSSANLAANAASVSINGFGFDPNPINDGVTFSGAGTGTRTPSAASATGMSVSLPSPLIAGALNASMTSNGVSSGTAVQVATITPVVTSSTASLAANATTVTISGAGFDPTALNNTVTFNNGAVGTVTSATNTSLTVTFSTNPASAGPLTAVVTTNSVSSGSAVQVASVIPVVTSSTANITTTASTVTINGFGFDSSNTNNSVTLNLGATGTVTTSSPTQIVVTFGVKPTAGNLTAVVTSNTQSSGAAVQVATVVNLSITSSTTNLAQNATQLIINGTGFSTTLGNNSVVLNSGTATVTAATATQLTCTLAGSPSLGALNATVTVTGTGTTGPTQVATIVAAPTVTLATTSLPINSTTVTIAGTGFDSSTPANNTVVFNNSATGTVTAATATSLTVTFGSQPAAVGSLTAVVTSFGGSSGTARQIATVAPVVTSATTNLAANASTVTINGFGFDSTAVNNVVTFNNSATGTVTSASSTSLTVTFGTKPASAGSLTASVTTNSVSSGTAVQVATVIPVITASTTSIQTTDNTVTINGFGFDSSNLNNAVSFNLGATGTVTTSSPTQLVVTFGVKPTVGTLNAVVTSNTQSSGSAVQVATVSSLTITSSTANLVQSSTTLDIAGTGFSTTAGNNTVTFNNGAVGTVTSATSTLLTVTFSTRATSLGALNATVSVSGVGSSGPTQVANVIAGAAAKLAVITQPSNTASGAAISPSVTVQIQDANGFLTTSTSSVTMAIGTNPSSGTLSGTVTVAAVAGTATFSTLNIDKVGTGYTLSASSGVLTSATSNTFNITPGAPAKLVVIAQPTNTVSAAAISPAVTVQIQDAAGNLTTSTANVVMAIGTNPSSGTLSGTVTVAAVAGTATFSTLNIDKAGTGYTLSATSGVLTSTTSSAFNITAGAPAKLAVIAQPTSAVSTTAISPAVTVQIQDAAGNLTTSTANVAMSIGTNPGSGTLSGTTSVAAVAGVATFSTLSIDKVGTGYTLSASSGVLTPATSNTFNITVGAPAKLAVITQPTNTVSATAISPAVTVQIQDAGGNLTSSTANVVMAIGTNPGSGTLSGTATVAAVAGTATFSTLNINKAGTGYTLSATSGVLTSTTSNTFNITAGAPAKLAVTTQPTNAVSATAISPSVVVQIQDAAGNLTTSTANVVMAIGTNPSSGTLSGTTTVAAVAGSATFSTLNIDKAGTGYTLSATSGVLTSATSNTFNITPGLPAKLAVTTQPTNTASATAISPSVVVQIQDAAGNLTSSTANVVMAIGTNPSSGTLSGTTTVAAVAGSATFSTLNIDKAGTGYTLSATSGVLTSATSNTFNITAGVASKLAVSVQPTNTASGTAISPAVTVQIQDAAGNLTTSTANVTMSIGTNPSSGTLSGTATVAAVAGTATFSNLSIDKAGTGYTLGAVSGILTPATSSTFNITAGAPAKLAVITQPTNAVSATTISPSVTVQIQDAAGNLTTSTANVAMSIGTNPGSGTLSGTTTVAAVAGTATFSTLSIDKAGTGYTLSAVSGILTPATSNTFNITAGAPAKLAVIAQPTSAVSATAISPAVTVQIQDAAGNLTTSTANVAMSIGTNPGSGTLSGTTTVAAVAGTATFSTLSINKAGTGYTLSAVSGILTPATSNTFNITAGAPAKLAVGTQPTDAVSATSISPAVTIRILDAADNLTTSTASVTMAIGTNPSSGTLSGTVTVAAVAGTATFSTLNIDKAGTGYTLSATSGVLTSTTSSAFNITAGAPAKLAVGTQPTDAVSATSISPAVTIRILDAAGNLTTSTATVAVAIGTNPSSGTLSGTTSVAAVAGTATFSTLNIDKAGTGYTLSASSGVLTPTTSSAFNITAGAPAKLAVITQPTSAVSATAISPAVTVQIQDAAGNLTTSTANVAMSIGTNPGSGTLSGTTTVAAVAGTATFSTLNIDKAGTGYTLSAVSGILTPATSNTFNITAGAPAKLAVGTQPTDAVSATSISPAVTIRILDAADNLTTSTASVTMAIGTNPSSGTLSGTVTVAAVAGTATFSTLNIDKAGTGYTLSASSGVLTPTTSSAFNITAGAPAKLAVNVQPTDTVSATAISPSVTVQILDAAGNLTTSTANVAVAIGTNPSSGTLSGTTSVAAVAGTATFSTLNIDKAGNGYTLSASSGVLTPATTNTFNITAGAPAKLAVIAQPTTTVAGVAISPAVTVQIQDAAGNLTTSTAGVTMAIGTNPGSSTLSGTLTVNAVAGTATFSTLSLNKTGTGYTLGATSGALTSATSGTFAITPAAAASLALSAPGTAAAGTPVSVSVTAMDAFGNTATGYTGTVQFASTDANAVLPANSTLTSGAGNFNVTFQNAGSQTVTGTDTVASAITGTSGSIVVSEAITLTASDTTAAVSGGDTGTYLFTRGGNGAAVTVNFALNGASTASSGEFTLSGGSVSFNGSTGSLTIPSSSTSVTLTLTANANATGVAKPSKTVQLDLASGTGYISGAPTTGTVTIAQNGFLVTTVADSGQGSLRQAVLNANAITGADTISFSDGTGGTVNFTDSTPDTIALSSGQISLSSDITISGPGPKLLTVQNSAVLSGTSRVFIVPTGTAKTVQLIGLTMTGGNCTTSGGGLLINSGSNASVLVIVSAITGNSTTQFGGGINQLSGNLTIVSSTISGNTAAASGSSGGIDATGNSLTLINSTVSGNSITSNAAANGAGIWTNVTTASILNSTITNNTAAGGISGVLRNGGTLTVANSIIAGNVNNTTLPDVGGAFTSSGGNIIGNVGTATGFTATNDRTGTGASPRDPLLGALADNGGHTLTHALLNGSPAINNGLAGNLPADTFDLDGNLNTTEALPVDQRSGVNIRQRGPAPDSGSFEAFAFEPTITASTTDEDIQSSSGLVITANTADGGLTTHYQITSILNGTLFQNNGTTVITAGSFITKAEGSAGLKFTPSLNLNSPNTAAGFGFTAQAAIGTSAPADLRGATVPVAITVNSINDLPTVVGTGLPDVRMTIGDVLVIPLGANFADVDLDTLTFTVSGNTVPAKASASITGTTNVTVTGLAYGTTNITIQADDGLMGTVTDTFEVAVGTENPTSPGLIGPVDPVTGLPLPPGSAYRFSNQTGGFEIDVPVQNTTAFAINGFRLNVDFSAYLAPNPNPLLSQPTLRLYNSTNNTREPNPAVPAYIDYPYPVAVGETVRIRLNFYTQTRRFPNPFVPVLTMTKLATSQTGGPLPSDLTFTPARIRFNNAGQVLLEWTSTPALWYRIYYSENMTTWFPSSTPIEATTNQMQWRDTGPPFTQTAPGSSRFYMVAPIAAPAP